MKNCFQYTFFLTILNFFAYISSAQVKLASKEMDQIKKQSFTIISDFSNYLERIASKDEANEPNKDLLIKRALSYFLDTATVEVSNKKTKIKHTYNIKKYLTEIVLKYRKRYAIVLFEAIPIKGIELSPIYEDGKVTGYEGSVRYRQRFSVKGFNKIQPIQEIPSQISYDYYDTTEKEAKIRVKKIESIDGKNIFWIIKLGDIQVLNTTD